MECSKLLFVFFFFANEETETLVILAVGKFCLQFHFSLDLRGSDEEHTMEYDLYNIITII